MSRAKKNTHKDAVDLDWLPPESRLAILILDEALVGTDAYLGFAMFWASPSREFEEAYLLRDASHMQRRAVHDAWRVAGLDLLGTTEAHRGLVRVILAKPALSRPRTKQNSGGVHDTVDNTWTKLAWRIAGGVRANERERQQEHAERAKQDAAR